MLHNPQGPFWELRSSSPWFWGQYIVLLCLLYIDTFLAKLLKIVSRRSWYKFYREKTSAKIILWTAVQRLNKPWRSSSDSAPLVPQSLQTLQITHQPLLTARTLPSPRPLPRYRRREEEIDMPQHPLLTTISPAVHRLKEHCPFAPSPASQMTSTTPETCLLRGVAIASPSPALPSIMPCATNMDPQQSGWWQFGRYRWSAHLTRTQWGRSNSTRGKISLYIVIILWNTIQPIFASKLVDQYWNTSWNCHFAVLPPTYALLDLRDRSYPGGRSITALYYLCCDRYATDLTTHLSSRDRTAIISSWSIMFR